MRFLALVRAFVLIPAALIAAAGAAGAEPARSGSTTAPAGSAIPLVAVAELPHEARETLRLIKRGGPFPYRRDGAVFGNYEQHLPRRGRGYYREYTVPTPGARDRGARRIIGGRPGEYYFTDDHYASFRRIRE